MSGQYGWTPLDSSEQFYISGADAVRAFVQGEAGGRSGLLGTVELRRILGRSGLTATAFVDAGRIMGDGTKDITSTAWLRLVKQF